MFVGRWRDPARIAARGGTTHLPPLIGLVQH
jgi:hypothetical protein